MGFEEGFASNIDLSKRKGLKMGKEEHLPNFSYLMHGIKRRTIESDHRDQLSTSNR